MSSDPGGGRGTPLGRKRARLRDGSTGGTAKRLEENEPGARRSACGRSLFRETGAEAPFGRFPVVSCLRIARIARVRVVDPNHSTSSSRRQAKTARFPRGIPPPPACSRNGLRDRKAGFRNPGLPGSEVFGTSPVSRLCIACVVERNGTMPLHALFRRRRRNLTDWLGCDQTLSAPCRGMRPTPCPRRPTPRREGLPGRAAPPRPVRPACTDRPRERSPGW